jgi:hypothetical protein
VTTPLSHVPHHGNKIPQGAKEEKSRSEAGPIAAKRRVIRNPALRIPVLKVFLSRMAMRMQRLNKMAKGRVYLALAYFIWSLLPHFHILFHSHAGGAHVHASFSTAQVAMANQVLDNLAPGELPGAAETEIGGEALASPCPLQCAPEAAAMAIAAGEAGLHPDSTDPNRHGHFWEDPNVAGLASGISTLPFLSALILAAPAAYLAPPLRAIGLFPARGPPAVLPA